MSMSSSSSNTRYGPVTSGLMTGGTVLTLYLLIYLSFKLRTNRAVRGKRVKQREEEGRRVSFAIVGRIWCGWCSVGKNRDMAIV
ncbi:hypothetical protein MBM_01484 [Drepanopeziza brunnea f. sp. 'multigermtubi' MB_m1]|uniref:Uncharacterized protein n=1 Tax=Marssonina brunnea f. sp. multigermtubi (strain MB_m1) TaxID=1072389 RepID=K1X6S3_MARBU|nr:uncharacterized protein MBM_01484 [Drepanopeziza brunnea f. sp. 'multigermtubi' MB_m1]EKD20802.1 hypothetical protein MBM_01484 [Drepanopeziza brunnea f. sp. 'multigermtubi' MB_m1]